MTLWELFDHHRGAMKDRWGRHAELMALLANANRDPNKQRRAYTPDEFNPYREVKPRRKPEVKVSMGAMMDAIFERKTDRMKQELSSSTVA